VRAPRPFLVGSEAHPRPLRQVADAVWEFDTEPGDHLGLHPLD
jgi:hypothetical protein